LDALNNPIAAAGEANPKPMLCLGRRSQEGLLTILRISSIMRGLTAEYLLPRGQSLMYLLPAGIDK
jgi:hypothetical protein